MVAARLGEETDAERLDEASGREGARQRQQGRGDGKEKVHQSGSADIRKPWRSAWNASHSLANPFSGGSPEMASAPTRKHVAVHGIAPVKPPISSMFRVPEAAATLPAPRNSRPLNTAWFST